VTEPIIVAHAEPGLLAHFPDIVRLADGRLLATWREGPGHVDSDGRIRVTDSADDGLTWSEPRTAADGPFDDRDPKLAVLADGTVLLSFFVLEWATRPRHTSHGTHVCRSTDGGLTWSEPAPIGDLRWAVSHGAAAQLPDGDVLLPLYGRPNREVRERAVIVRSTDNGLTWATDEAVELTADETDLQEPTLTVLGDEVVALIRTTAGHAYLARSSDGGRKWSVPQPTDMPASSHHALLLSSGEVLVTYGDLSPRFSEHRDTVGRLVTRPDGTWDGYPDIHLYDSGHPDQANPSSAEVAPGRFLTLGFDVPKATVIGVFTDAADYRR